MARRCKDMVKAVRRACEHHGLEVIGFETTPGHQFVRFRYRGRVRRMSFPFSPGRGLFFKASKTRVRNHLRGIDEREGRS